MEEKPTSDVWKPLPQESRQKHKIVIMHEHDIPFFVDAGHCLQEKLICMGVCLDRKQRQGGGK